MNTGSNGKEWMNMERNHKTDLYVFTYDHTHTHTHKREYVVINYGLQARWATP